MDIADQYFEMTRDGSSDARNMVTTALPDSLCPPGPRHSRLMVGSSTNTLDLAYDTDLAYGTDLAYDTDSFVKDFLPDRPPWTPPPTPRNSMENDINGPETLATFGTYHIICNGRRFVSGLSCCQAAVPANSPIARLHSRSITQ